MISRRKRAILLTATLLLGTCFTACVEAQEKSKTEKKKTPTSIKISEKQLEAWINQLSEGSFRERRAASNNLLRAGKQALTALVKGAQRKDAELNARCFDIIAMMYRGKNKTLNSAAKKSLQELEKSSDKLVVRRAKKTLLEGAITKIKKLGGIVMLDKLGKVKYVNFRETKVTASDLVHLKGMTSLVGLILDSTKVTDAGLAHLKGLNSLQTLKIQHTKVTYPGVKDFKSALPKCGVIW